MPLPPRAPHDHVASAVSSARATDVYGIVNMATDPEDTSAAGKPRAPLSAYFIFLSKEQATIRQQIAEQTGRERVPLAEVQKAVSERWKNLSAEERQAYNEEARLRKEEHLKQAAQHGKEKGGETKMKASVGESKRRLPDAEELFPQARINKICKLDPTLPRVTAVAAQTMNLATVLALRRFAILADGCRRGRGTLMKEDVLTMIRRGGADTKVLQGILYALDTDGSSDDEGRADLHNTAINSRNAESDEVVAGARSGQQECTDLKRDSACGKERPTLAKPRNWNGAQPAGNKKKKGGSRSLQCADITSFFSRVR